MDYCQKMLRDVMSAAAVLQVSGSFSFLLALQILASHIGTDLKDSHAPLL